MQMPMLDLNFDSSPDIITKNRDLINAEIMKLEAVVKYLKGLHGVNQGVCKHGAKHAVYDPGYAGGGQDGYRCPTCEKRGYF